ncbi:MAG TPA: helix-turn-helix transcriptional regulator [Thermoanaerobaculia bacterium]|nr:helix-turn-helix transcriptional regulator [Thermoanaerobaculia bacterium]
MAQEEIQRLLHVLRVAMRILDVSNRDIEKKLGFSYGYLSRLFAGNIELKVDHILQIVEVLGLTPAEFFQLAYPRRPSPPSEAAVRMKAILEGIGPFSPDERPSAAEVSSEQIEQVVSSMLRKLLKDAKP